MIKRILEVNSDTPYVDWSILVKNWFDSTEQAKFEVKELNEMTASEALFGFCGWLTSRKERTILSSGDNASDIVQLLEKFITTNKLTEPRDDWTVRLKHPEE